MNINVKDIGLTRLGIKPKSTAPEADALTTRPSKLLKFQQFMRYIFKILNIKKIYEAKIFAKTILIINTIE